MKIYKKGNYIYLVNAVGDIKQDHANEVKITKTNVATETYSIYSDDLGVNYVTFSELTQENGTPYASVSAWELWYSENTGFNPASGGSGAGTVINTVSNYASLPDATLVANDFYWVSSATGYRILGTYKTNGLYYSNGISWEYIDAPTTATQSEVNTGTLTDKYLTPSTFENATKWTNYLDKTTYDADNDGIVDKAKKEVVQVINKTGATLTKGTIVYINSTSSSANYPEVLKANATTDAMSSKTIGAIFEDILDSAVGLVVTSGEVNNLNTSSYSNGTKLWLSTIDGQVTSTIPIQPYHNVFIGTVTRSQTTNGRILYSIQNGYELDELHNVLINNGTLANNDILTYDSANLLWKNKPNTPITSTASLNDSLNKRFVTDANLTTIGNQSGINTGDQDLSGKVDKITGKGLSTEDYTTAEKTKLSNQSGTNTGDETTSTIKTKLGVASSSNDGYLSSADWNTFNNSDSKPFEVYRGITFTNNSTTVVSDGGVTMSSTASTLAQTVASTNFVSKQIRLRYYASVVSAGKYTGTRGSTLLWFIGGGFRFICDVNISDTSFSAGCQQFYGLAGQTTDLNYGGATGILVSTLTNIIGIGSENGDTNLQVFHNDGTGTATKIDLGINFPANRTAGAISTTVYSIELLNRPSSTNILYKIINNETGSIATGTISTNLPLDTQGLNFFASRCMSTTSVTNTGQFDLSKLGVYSQL